MTVILAGALLAVACFLAAWIGLRVAGWVCWGTLVPAYVGFMLIVFPATAYLLDWYAPMGYELDPADIAYLYLSMAAAMVGLATGYLLLGSGPRLTRLRRAVQSYGQRMASVFRQPHTAAVLLVVYTFAAVWSLKHGYFGLANRETDDAAAGAGAINLVFSGLLLAHPVLWVNALEQPSRRSLLLLATIGTGLALGFGFAQNSKSAMLVPLMQIVLAVYFVRGRLPWLSLAALVSVFWFFALPVVQGFRYAVYFNLADKTPATYLPLFFEYVLSGAWLTDSQAPEGENSLALGRGLFPYLVAIFRDTGTAVPTFAGQTYWEGFAVMIPRALFPDKPDLSLGNWTGQWYGFVDIEDTITNVSPSWFGELYMNFGLIGLVAGAVVVGWVGRLIDEAVFVRDAAARWLMVVFAMNVAWLEAFVGSTLLVFLRVIVVFSIVVLLVGAVLTPSAAARPGRRPSDA
jgi:oligosaccharide repeat unit polymerase